MSIEKIDKNFAYLILGFNSDELTLKLIEGIRDFDAESIIVVVDNSVENKPLETKIASFRKIQFICSGSNLGYARGNNLGLRYLSQKCDVDFVFICNPDIELDMDSVLRMKVFICEHQCISILGSRMLDTQANEQLSHWDCNTLVQDIIGDFSSLRFLLYFLKKPIPTRLNTTAVQCDVVNGAFFLADLDVLHQVNYFDERTFLYCEERILAKRLDKYEAKRYILNSATCKHRASSTISEKFPTRLDRHLLLIRSRMVFYRYYSSRFKFFMYGLFAPFSIFEKALLDLFRMIIETKKK